MRTLVAVSVVLSLCACEKPPPARLDIDSKGAIVFGKRGQTRGLEVAAFDAKGKPYVVGNTPVTWSSTDPSVATVDAKGTITATGSGKAQVKASAWGIESAVDVTSSIPGSIEVTDPKTTKDAPLRMRLSDKPKQLVVVVKDDKGNVIEKPKVLYRALDYCVEADEAGQLRPLAEGECVVVVSVGEPNAKVWVDVH